MKRTIAFAAIASILLSACGNTVYGPRRIVQTGQFDGDQYSTGSGDSLRWHNRQCTASGEVAERSAPLDFTMHFYDLACASFRAPDDPQKAQRMMNAGVTLNMIRCNDFFAQRAANQTRGRVVREAIPPVSALLTGILGLLDFETVEGQEEAIQILALGQNATVATLEVFQREFLFDSDNVFAVRRLTMRALDEHSSQMLSSNAGFYAATRHLIEHQMICTPASMLELVTQAIDRSEITSASGRVERELQTGFANDRARIDLVSRMLNLASPLTADQVGALWLLINFEDANQQAIATSRLEGVDIEQFDEEERGYIDGLSEGLQAHFREIRTRLPNADELAEMQSNPEGPQPPAFTYPAGFGLTNSRRIEVEVAAPPDDED